MTSADKLENGAEWMKNLSQSAWGIAEPKMYGDTITYDASLQGFFMAVYEYCAETSDLLRQAAGRLRKLEEIAKQAESVCRKLEHPTASVTYLDQEALRAALSSLKGDG